MKRLVFAAAIIAALVILVFLAPAQNQPAKGKGPSADPYANNPDAGKQSFPLAAPAGKDSNAINVALPGGTNQGTIEPGNWKYGPQFMPPQGAKIWNPVKQKLMAGGKVTGGTLFTSADP